LVNSLFCIRCLLFIAISARAKLLLQCVCVCVYLSFNVIRQCCLMRHLWNLLTSTSFYLQLANKQIINRFCFSVLIVFTKFVLPAAFRLFAFNFLLRPCSPFTPTAADENQLHFCKKSVETAIPVVVPLEKWLQDRLSSWVQLSGHDGTIVPASDSTLWKKRASNESNESNAYIKLMNDPLSNFVAKFYLFIEIEDLTRHFNNPAIMDVKIGTRTFLESEVNNPAKRADLYKKMIAIDGNEPTEEEHADKAITKLRYMQFRERESSTAEFGFRIEAIKSSDGHTEKNFKRVKSKDEIMEILINFFGPDSKKVRGIFVKRLKVLRRKLLRSAVFMTHEFIGSSLLFMYDKKHADVWMIDFAKVCPVETVTLNHTSSWQLGNHEDGYFVGLDNLIQQVLMVSVLDWNSIQPS
ncbi:Inositol-trisphosphate 3-kinase A, partial [Trichinella papuae]